MISWMLWRFCWVVIMVVIADIIDISDACLEVTVGSVPVTSVDECSRMIIIRIRGQKYRGRACHRKRSRGLRVL